MYSLILSVILITSCLNQKSDLNTYSTVVKNETIKEGNFYKKWSFKIDNENAESIGYKIYTDDESIGIKSICIEGEYIYVTDVYHTSIKQININTGEMKSSKSLSSLPADESGIWLRDIAVFNDKIYVTADRNMIYVFSKDLNLLQSIPTSKGRKNIESVGQNAIEIFLKDEQLPDKSIEKTLLSIDEKGNVSTIKKQIPIQEHTKKQLQLQGKEYKTYTKSDKNYFECEYGTIELKNPIPEIKEYGAGNLNFNSTTLVYYNSTPTEFTLYVYKY